MQWIPHLSHSGMHFLIEVQIVLSSSDGTSFKIPKRGMRELDALIMKGYQVTLYSFLVIESKRIEQYNG